MTAPAILALDFDGVLCEGTREYFEVSRRTYDVVWPEGPRIPEELFPGFRELRPVIETGWEMPVLLQGLVLDVDREALSEAWPATRDALLARDPRPPEEQIALLRKTLDAERRRWIDHDRPGWLARHAVYGEVGAIRRLVAVPDRVAIVTTKEGEFVRHLLDHWGIAVADVEGKETGSHKCDNLRRLRAAYTADTGKSPVLWFVEDRLETLLCVRRHRDLDDVRTFLATWGYNTARTRDAARATPGIELLSLAEFMGGFSRWGSGV